MLKDCSGWAGNGEIFSDVDFLGLKSRSSSSEALGLKSSSR